MCVESYERDYANAAPIRAMSIVQLAAHAGCTVERLKARFARHAESTRRMLAKAQKSKHGTCGGFTAAQLERALAYQARRAVA